MGSNGGLARNLTEYEAVTGSWRYLIEHRKRVAAVTPADVMRIANKYFTAENRMIGFVTRKGGPARNKIEVGALKFTTVFSNSNNYGSADERKSCAVFRELSLYNRESVLVTFSAEWYRNYIKYDPQKSL